MTWRCWFGWHAWTPWSLPFPMVVETETRKYGITVAISASHEIALQNRRCRVCGTQQQRQCGLYTTDVKSQQFVRQMSHKQER